MSEYQYDHNYRPAFPAIRVVLHNSEAQLRTLEEPALLDSGADGTLVPLHLLRQLDISPVSESRIRSHWGEWRIVQLFLVDVEIAGLKLVGMFVVGDEVGEEIVLGRNILNRLRIVLDGTRQVTEIPFQ